MFKLIVTNPWLNFSVALTLMLSGFAEVFDNGRELAFETLGAEHGAALYGLIRMLQALAEGLDGAKDIPEDLERTVQ